MLGQGQSDKPSLFIDQDDQVIVLGELIKRLGARPVFVAGISFGGVIALRHAIAHSDTIAGLVPMSSFAEVPSQLFMFGTALRTALILGGTGFLQDLLFPMNFSGEWLESKRDLIELARHRGWLANDVYALQNLMELFDTPAADAATVVDPSADADLNWRIRLPHSPAASGKLANEYPRQRAGHRSARLSCVHAGETGTDGLHGGTLRRRRDGRPLARHGNDLGGPR